MKVFISYAHEDKARVGEIKRELEFGYGFEVFIAHEDIAPTLEWVNEIISALNTCSVLIAFLTENFNNSEWTDQEVGFALAKGTKIIPLNAGVNPRGFISRYQSLSFSTVQIVCQEIIKILAATPELKEAVIDLLIKVYGETNTYRDAASNFDRIIEFEDLLNIQQKNEIVRLAGINDQIYHSWRAADKINSFIERQREVITQNLWRDGQVSEGDSLFGVQQFFMEVGDFLDLLL